MTVTLEITPNMEAVLSAKAKLFGLALPDYLDPVTVYILSVRHGAHKPITRAEAREIESDE